MQLVCNGHRLDLYDNTELQFTEENPLFAFDNIKCERTTNFKLPATPANDRVFALARIPAYAGEGMRRKFTAQLQMGTIVKDGYLYVSSWSGKEYEAIFVTGEMVGLQRIKDAGKLKDLIQESDRLIWNEANTHGANSSAGREKYAITRYKTDAALCLPSFDLADIIEDASFGIITPSLQLDKRNWRIIAPKAEPIDERQVTMEFVGTGADPSSDISNPQLARSANISGLSWLGSYASQTILVFVNNAQRYYSVRQFVCGQDIMLTFSEDFSADIFLMSFGNDAMYNTLKTEYFLGDYYFSNNTTTGQGIVRHGTPLAKKSVRINARTPFTFVQASDYDYNRNAPQVEGFRWLGYGNLTASFKVEGIETKEGDYVMLHDILPDITLADALKVYAYLRGEQLYYTDKDGVQFDDLFFISWPRFDISKRLLSIGKVTRTFSEYAQHNLVQFDSAEDVPQNTRVITEYTLDNDNISESKEVGKIPFNEGEIDAADGVIVARFDAEDVEKNTLPKYGIAVAGQSQFMERIQLPKNAGIQALCDASTQVEVQARMSAYEYAQINAKTRILCRGTEYVWTSRSWQKDTAKFVLAKLPPLDYNLIRYMTLYTSKATWDAETGTLTSTRTRNTNPNSNQLEIQKYFDNSYLGIMYISRSTGYMSFTFVKTSEFNRIRTKFNGNAEDAFLNIDASILEEGATYELSCNITILDRTNTGNDAQLTNLRIVRI